MFTDLMASGSGGGDVEEVDVIAFRFGSNSAQIRNSDFIEYTNTNSWTFKKDCSGFLIGCFTNQYGATPTDITTNATLDASSQTPSNYSGVSVIKITAHKNDTITFNMVWGAAASIIFMLK